MENIDRFQCKRNDQKNLQNRLESSGIQRKVRPVVSLNESDNARAHITADYLEENQPPHGNATDGQHENSTDNAAQIEEALAHRLHGHQTSSCTDRTIDSYR